LLLFLTWRDIKVRYKQTLLGALWAAIQPIGMMVLFSLLFGGLARMPSDDVPYPLFAYVGLLCWTFVANAVTASGNSLVGNASLITKVYFPRVIIPGAAVLGGLVDFAIACTLLVPLMLYWRLAPSWTLAMMLPLSLLMTLLALAVGLLASALNVKYRDVRHALPFLVQLWMFATPIIYPASLVPPSWRWALGLNPMTGIVEGFRAALFGRDLPAAMLATPLALTLGLLGGAMLVFRRLERTFADVV
jgi:lipopolysaccharide transport system permease protein